MKLETINAIAQLIAAIGVIASLFYLAVQIRQNTLSQRSVVVDSLTNSLITLVSPQSTDPVLTRAFASAIDDWWGVSEDERVRAATILFPLFKLFENAWFQKRQGTLDSQQWEGWDAYMRMYYHRPGTKIWWQMRRAAFASGFRDYIEPTEPIPDMIPLSGVIQGKP